MFLGIEIGGTKLQLGVGLGDGAPLAALERFTVDPGLAAAGILETIDAAATKLIARHQVSAIGIGFGGPVDSPAGRVIKSHQIEGWDDFELVTWCRRRLGIPARLQNDCDVAALAEARFGAGRDARVVFYITVGTGVGGGLVVDQRIFHGAGPSVAEIGHLRPGLHADHADDTVESLASGWGISAAAQSRIADPDTQPFILLQARRSARLPDAVRKKLMTAEDAEQEYAADLRSRAGGNIEHLTAKMVAQAAADGNEVARDVLSHACQALGWAIAQMITLVSPGVVVVGGGVSLIEESLFLLPLMREIDRYVFPPLLGTFQVLPAALSELAVVQGALVAAAQMGEP